MASQLKTDNDNNNNNNNKTDDDVSNSIESVRNLTNKPEEKKHRTKIVQNLFSVS